MAEKEQEFSVGDWIVHSMYGIGQVEEIERKELLQQENLYYKVKSNDSVFWIPVGGVNDTHIRPLASTRELKKALRILKKAPAEMEQNHKKRTSRIKRVKMKGSLSAVCRLVRDLSARGKVKSLNTTERRALDFFKDILLREWSISIGMTMDDARKELQKMLKESHAKLPAEG